MLRAKKVFQILGSSADNPLLVGYLNSKGFDKNEVRLAGLYFQAAIAVLKEEFPEYEISDREDVGHAYYLSIRDAEGEWIDPYSTDVFPRVQAADRRFIRMVFGVRWDYYR